ncbi:MAG: macro domain-containing protein [Chloroflexi bacterium]|nr:macro domain-containing protein [Chloroflexota bacterium]
MSQILARQALPGGQQLLLVHGDLTAETVDAIVNAANARLQHGGGVAGAISRRGGPSIQAESDAWVRQHGPVSHERPSITGAGRLPCRFVIHAVGPVWGSGDEDRKLGAAVGGALQLAHERGLPSLALPPISTGIFGFPVERGARVILDAALAFCAAAGPDSPLREIRFTMIDDKTAQVFAREFERRFGRAA